MARLAIPPALFLPGWSGAAIAAGVHDAAAPVGQAIVHVAALGIDVPVVSAILAVAGVVLARPIAPKGPAPLTLWQTLLRPATLRIDAVDMDRIDDILGYFREPGSATGAISSAT